MTVIVAAVAGVHLVAAGGVTNRQQQPTFSVAIDLVTTDAMPRDSRTQRFISDLKPEELTSTRTA